MPLFPSAEWMHAFCRQVTMHPRATEAAANLGGGYRFVIDPAGPLRERQTYAMVLGVEQGQARAERVDVIHAPRVTVQSDYHHWRQLLEGRLDIGPAILFRRLRVSGDMAALVGSSGDVDVLVDALRGVDTVWLDAVR